MITPLPDLGCPHQVLHRTAELEIEIYGEILSESVADHVAVCRPPVGVVLSW